MSAPGRPRSRPTGARVAVAGYFVVTGVVLATWAVYLPQVKQRLALDDNALGLALLMLAIGALAGMQAAGRITQRFGSRAPARSSAGLAGLLLAGPAIATSVVSLGAALFMWGVAAGVLQVATNAQAVAVEQRYHRPIMASFHAAFSVGGIAGALIGFAGTRAGATDQVALPVTAVLSAVVFVAIGRRLLPAEHERPATVPDTAPTGRSPARSPAAAWRLGALAAACLLCEGAAVDWSAVHLTETVGASAMVASLGYAAYSTAMTVGRIVGDRLVAALGPVRILRYGGGTAAVGFAMIGLSSAPVLVIAGWVLAGAGLCCVLPQIFSTAGNLPTGPRALALTTTLGYLGLLGGPPLIGFAGLYIGLGTALLIPAVLGVGVAAGARFVRPAGPPGYEHPRRPAAATTRVVDHKHQTRPEPPE